jgi:Flp pilus assembly protein TadG
MTGAARRARARIAHRRRAVHEQPERGYSVLEAAITLPAMFLLTMLVVQWAVLWHARNVAQAAAQEGLRTARGYESSADAGQADAESFLAQVAPRALPDATVTVDRSATSVTVRVHASVMSVVPFSSLSVDESATGPVEAYVGAR